MKKEEYDKIMEYSGVTVFVDTETLTEAELMVSNDEYASLNRESDEAEIESCE